MPGVIYGSINNDRQWILHNGIIKTRVPGDIWRDAGWPQPTMKESDIDYYIATGEMKEARSNGE